MKSPAAGQLRRLEVEVHRGPKMAVTGHTVHHHMLPSKGKSASGAFMEETHHSFPFDANGESSTHGNMMDHIESHLGLMADAAKEGEGEPEPEEEEEG